MSNSMTCQLCGDTIEFDPIVCKSCCETQNIHNDMMIQYLIQQFSDVKHVLKELAQEDYSDNYKTKAIKQTRAEVYSKVYYMLKNALEYSGVNVDAIKESNCYVDKPTMCQMDRSKICSHCMDC